MRKIKNCPFCDVKMETTDYRYYFHPDNDCILHGFGIDVNYRRSVESWNTRKPMERIMERLEEQQKLYKEAHATATWTPDKIAYVNTSNGIGKAIEIVKEEGKTNE